MSEYATLIGGPYAGSSREVIGGRYVCTAWGWGPGGGVGRVVYLFEKLQTPNKTFWIARLETDTIEEALEELLDGYLKTKD